MSRKTSCLWRMMKESLPVQTTGKEQKIHPINVPLPINQVPVPVLPAANRVSEGKPKRNSLSTILLRVFLS